jgi:hypothetical protein
LLVGAICIDQYQAAQLKSKSLAESTAGAEVEVEAEAEAEVLSDSFLNAEA